MLNVLSFFFILIELANQQFDICFDAQRSELFLYQSKQKLTETDTDTVSMLNVLSFFFMSFSRKSRSLGRSHVSMLNVLSFFFIAHSTTAMNKRLLRGISEETSPCALFIHFYHYTTINKAVENCSEKILKLKIISPPLLYKYL